MQLYIMWWSFLVLGEFNRNPAQRQKLRLTSTLSEILTSFNEGQRIALSTGSTVKTALSYFSLSKAAAPRATRPNVTVSPPRQLPRQDATGRALGFRRRHPEVFHPNFGWFATIAKLRVQSAFQLSPLKTWMLINMATFESERFINDGT